MTNPKSEMTHCVTKKVVHQTHGNNFVKNSFTAGGRTKFPTICLQYFPPYLQYVAALPCES